MFCAIHFPARFAEQVDSANFRPLLQRRNIVKNPASTWELFPIFALSEVFHCKWQDDRSDFVKFTHTASGNCSRNCRESFPNLPKGLKLRLLVVDHPIIVSALTAMSHAELEFDVVHADSVEAGLAAFRLHRPSDTVAEYSFADGSGVDLIRQIHHVDPDARVILLSMSNDPIFHERALQAGANSCLSKMEDPYLLIEAVRRIAKASTPNLQIGVLKSG